MGLKLSDVIPATRQNACLELTTSHPMEVDIDSATEQELKRHVLDTVEGETCFFRAIMRSRPVGMHRHFHVLSIKHAIEQGTGQSISVDDIWAKLRSCYNLDALESLVREFYIYAGQSTLLYQICNRKPRMKSRDPMHLRLKAYPHPPQIRIWLYTPSFEPNLHYRQTILWTISL